LSPPSPPHLTDDVVVAAAITPLDFKAMAAKQNLYPEMQPLLGGSSLGIAFRLAGAQHLVGDVSTAFSHSGARKF
jgi:hypothetical protein